MSEKEKRQISTDLAKSPPMEEQLVAVPINIPPVLYFATEIGQLKEKLIGTSNENAKLREKLKTFKKENGAMNHKINILESQNKEQTETIRTLEIANEKVQKDLEAFKKAKDKLRIEVEEKISKVSKENEILTKRLEALTNDFDAVENENKELKRNLEQLRSDNALTHQEYEKLKDDMEKLKKEHAEIREKLDRKEIRLSLGQVPWMLEAEIWTNVLPKMKMGKTGILFGMEKWLKKNAAIEEGKAAQTRWDKLKGELKWDDDEHKVALKILKDLRLGDAHPNDVDLKEARKQLEEGEYVGDVFQESCQEIIEMITKARSLNEVKQ